MTTDRSWQRLRGVPWKALAKDADDSRDELGAAIDAVLAGQAADKVLERFLRARPESRPDLRTAFAEAIFGVGLWRRRLGEGTGLDLLDRLVEGTVAPAGFADRWSLPNWLAAELQRTGQDADALADALNHPGPVCLRANTLKVSRDALAAKLTHEGVQTVHGAHAPHALVVTSPRPNLYGLDAAHDALFEVQDEGSQLLGECVEPARGDEVIDLCAGAGGKTLQLAAALHNYGRVHATDIDLGRLERLRTRATRAGATCVSVHGKSLPPSLKVVRVLVDAPCSELGSLRRGPDLRWRLDPKAFDAFPALQLSLLETAVAHLMPGGRLVYATCTFRKEENEDVVRAFEARHPRFTRVRSPLLPDADGFLRTWPHLHGTDAFFASLWRAPADGGL